MLELIGGVVGALGLFIVGMWFLTENLKQGSIKIRGVKRRNRPPSESRTGVRGRCLDVRDVDVGYFDPTDFDTPV